MRLAVARRTLALPILVATLVAILVGLAGTTSLESRAEKPTAVIAPAAARVAPSLPVRFLGDDAGADARARAALLRVLATDVGLRARQLMESGVLRDPVTIEMNHLGDQYTRYRVPGRELSETIVFDPDRLPLVDTDQGPLPALPETVLAHELGHAVFKLVSEDAVIAVVENPVRDALGVPRRRSF